ncbi:MAG: 6,7-dimethyl-8-ribityllumazine synthase [Actinomycetia bacterium]|nr:6,7-dimethyl-8-ribityllumazine synthase [Actinomycetes bacterium]
MRLDEPANHSISADGLRIGVVTATFNEAITSGLKKGALEILEESDATEVIIADVPGAFELPLMAQRLALQGCDAIVCLGAVVEGDTDHYEHVAHRASEGLMRVQLDTGIPVSFGVLTTRDVAAAIARSQPGPDNKGREAALAAILMARELRDLESPSTS